MKRQYPKLESENDIKQVLNDMEIDIYEPESKKEESLAEAMGAFSSFVLHEEPSKCQTILDDDKGDTVGELQGGNSHFRIYRVSIPEDVADDETSCNDAAVVLLREFHLSKQGKRYGNVLTIERLKLYMLGMCARRANERGYRNNYESLGNLMFILQFGGPTDGQVRHIDNMVPNVQICLYMSCDCPSTVVYEMDGDPITNSKLLLEHWINHEDRVVPILIRRILEERGDVPLKGKWYTKFFAFWGTINYQLNCFGKLYQPVAFQHSLQTDPGTTLLAGGNEVHAGPPTVGPRMFAFAIGIPEEGNDNVDGDGDGNGNDDMEENDDGDGEVQYSPVLLHIDFMTILFSILDHEYSKEPEQLVREAKCFLLDVLMAFLKDYPMREYLQQISEDRSDLLKWLDNLLTSLDHDGIVRKLMNQATDSKELFYSPDVVKRVSKRKQKR